MAKKYLGESPIGYLAGTPFDGFKAADWAMEFISRYGQIDGEHHKQWVLDQVARILKGTPVIVTLARWSDGQSEYRFTLGKPSDEYLAWVQDMRTNDGSDDQYAYDEGIAP